MASLFEMLGVLFFSFGLNLIPFAGPSNLFIASNAALMVSSDPFTLGFLVAFGSACAKGIHYLVTFFVSKRLNEKWRKRLDAERLKVKKWAFLLLFVAAATPIPDEPIVIPLGLMKYSPVKFFASYFLGKLTIGIAGAALGGWTEGVFSGIFSHEAMITLSIILTVVITVILLKVDVGKLAGRIVKKKPKAPEQDTVTSSNGGAGSDTES